MWCGVGRGGDVWCYRRDGVVRCGVERGGEV